MPRQRTEFPPVLRRVCDDIVTEVLAAKTQLPQLLAVKYRATVYGECDSVRKLEDFCFCLLKRLGSPDEFSSQNMQRAMGKLQVVPPTHRKASDFFAEFCKASPDIKGAWFYWCWKNFCCWMYEVVSAWTIASPPRYMLAFLRGRTQRNDAGDEEQHIVPHSVSCTENLSLGMTSPCNYCHEALQRKGCTEVHLTDNVQGELSTTRYTMHGHCYEFLRCWTEIHRIAERTAAACTNEAFDQSTFYAGVILPAVQKMHRSLTAGPRKRKRGKQSAREQQVAFWFQC